MHPMIVTVTLNPALDKTITISELRVGDLNRVQQIRLDPGGKGINVAKVLKNFSEDVIATGYIGNSQREFIQRNLHESGIKTAFVEVNGVTRTNLKIVDNKTKVTTEINEPGFQILPEDKVNFSNNIARLLQDASFLVLGGSLPLGIPEDIYKDYIVLAKDKNVKTILDADGTALKEGIKARPFAVKPNIHELERLIGRSLTTDKEIVAAGHELIAEGITIVIISMGSKGAIVLNKAEAFRVIPFPIIPQSTVGAGDSMVAATVYALLQNKSLEEVARWATTAGTVTASKPGTDVCTLAEVENSLNKVNVTWIQP